MSETVTHINRLIERSKGGETEALGELLQFHRAYLKLLVRRSLAPRLASRLDESDLVQQTCLSAHCNFAQFRGTTAAEFVAWLRRIHELNLQNQVRNQRAARRNPDRERSLDAADEAADRDSSPSQRSLQGERAVLLAAALETIPAAQAEAVRLRHLEGLPLAQIATRMGRTEQSVVGLIKRGMDGLRSRLKSLGEIDHV